jgi:hypothetical protein
MNTVIDQLLTDLDIHPVLIDIGASGAPPAIWESIAPHSIYVGFDPDLREMHEIPDTRFQRAVIVDEAISSSPEDKEILFYLTKSPYCSSTLKPDTDALSDYVFSDLFTIDRETTVHATTLNEVVERLSLPRIDWFKTDSQGTDLRLFTSLRDDISSSVLAIDIEPGLIDAYVGEDLFADAHKALTERGFWLSNLDVCGTIRMKSATVKEITATNMDIDEALIERSIRRTPCWVEARYLRTPKSLIQVNAGKREFALLWVFALIDNQTGFAIDLALEYERIFGGDKISQLMKDEPLRRIRDLLAPAPEPQLVPASLRVRVLRKLRRGLSRPPFNRLIR